MRKFFATLFFLWLAALLILTYYPHLPTFRVRIHHEWFRLDYIGHFGVYAVLMGLFLVWRSGWRNKIPRKLLLIALPGGFILASLTELTQSLIPGRTLNPFDLMYNCLGVVAGTMGAMVLAAWRKKGGKTVVL